MARFGAKRQRHISKGLIISLVVIVITIALFVYASSTLDKTQSQEQLELLSSSLDRSITQCYALEGSYPSGISYLEDHYGLTYDKDKYYIDYQFIGGNLRPDVTIIERTQ